MFLAFKKIQMVRITPCQISTTEDFPPSYWGDFPPEKTLEKGVYNIFLRKYIISKSVMENNTTSKTKKPVHSVLPPFLQGGGGGGDWKSCNVDQKEIGLPLFEFLKGELISGG